MTQIDPRVRDGWDRFNGPMEGPDIRTLYRDTRGLVTVATGILCNSVAAVQQYAWVRPDGSPASPDEVALDFHRVEAMPAARVWTYYATPGALRLADGEVERAVLARLDADVAILAHTFPDFAAWPWQAQAATLSMAWAMGAGFPATWPHWSASARAGDWRGCAANCQIAWQGNPGVRPRDLVQQALFLLASGATWDEARAGWPTGPVVETALCALAGLGLPETSAQDFADDGPPTPRTAGDGT